MTACSITDCPERAITRGWCKTHYIRWTRHGDPNRGHLTPAKRFWSKVDIGSLEQCWTWLGSYKRGGYGQFWLVSKMVSAHRVAYELAIGPIPEGLTLDHLCRNRGCVNPHHLEPVTNRENVLRSPISPTAINFRKTHCIHGHPLDGLNLKTDQGGYRHCRKCANRRNREYRVRKALAP